MYLSIRARVRDKASCSAFSFTLLHPYLSIHSTEFSVLGSLLGVTRTEYLSTIRWTVPCVQTLETEPDTVTLAPACRQATPVLTPDSCGCRLNENSITLLLHVQCKVQHASLSKCYEVGILNSSSISGTSEGLHILTSTPHSLSASHQDFWREVSIPCSVFSSTTIMCLEEVFP